MGMHISIAGGLHKMAEKARDFGLETIQIFSRSPRGGLARDLGPEEVEAAKRILGEASIHPLVVHTPYFVNLCASEAEMRAYGVATVTGELERAALLGSPYVVTHLGRPGDGVGEEEALALAASTLAEILGRPASGGAVMLLIENTAGAGREVGSDLESLARLLERLEDGPGGRLGTGAPLAASRLGICLDTCHAHAAGYNLSTPEGVGAFTGLAERLFGRDRVRVVHANDSVGEAGSRKDRHAAIGEGTIGREGFRALLRDPLLQSCPFLLETSGSDEERAESARSLAAMRER